MSDQNENISITLRAKIDELQRASTSVIGELDRIRKSTDDVNKTNEEAGRTSDIHAKALSRQAVSAVAAGGAIAVASMAIYQMTKAAIDAADELNDLSQKTGVSVEQLAGLKLAAEQNGTTLESVAHGVRNLSRFMVSHGEVLKSVGITSRDADGAMLQLSDLFRRMPDGIEKTNLAVKVFGRSGQDMIPLLNQGSAGLQEVIEKGQKLNPVTAEMAKQADLFNDQLAEMKAAAQGVGTVMANAVLPTLNAVISRLLEGATASRSMAGGLNALVYGAYTDNSLKKKIADYEGGNEGGILQDQYEQMVREARRRGIMSGELKATTFSDAGFEAQQRADEEAVRKLTTPEKKPPKPKKEKDQKPQLSTEEAALLDEWSAAVIREDMGDAIIALQDRDDELTMMAQAQRERRVERIEADLMSDREREQLAFAERMAFLQSSRTQELAEAEQHGLDQMEIHARYAKLMEGITVQQLQVQQMRNAQSVGLMASAFQDAYTVMSVMGNKHTALAKALFIASKAAAIADIFINTQRQAALAGAQTGLFGIPMQAYIEAAGYARMAAVAATGWQEFRAPSGGGGIGGNLSGGGSANFSSGFDAAVQTPAAQSQPAGPTREIAINVVGEFFDLKTMTEKFLPKLEEAIGNGAGNLRFVIQQG